MNKCFYFFRSILCLQYVTSVLQKDLEFFWKHPVSHSTTAEVKPLAFHLHHRQG